MLRPAGALPPIVVPIMWVGERAQFDRLAEALGPEQPVFVIDPPPAENWREFRRYEDFAKYARTCLDELPVEPPYRLVGWSFGGTVALELARQLTSEGIPVASLDLIDTPLPWRRTVNEKLSGWIRERKRRIKRRPGRASLQDPRLLRASRRAFKSYEPRPYSGAVSIYPSEQTIAKRGEPTLGWSPWMVGGIRVVPVPGTHYSLWKPMNVPVLAEGLRTATLSA